MEQKPNFMEKVHTLGVPTSVTVGGSVLEHMLRVFQLLSLLVNCRWCMFDSLSVSKF
jgi:hypothetical protein